MSSAPSTSTSHSNFVSIFNAALEAYRRKTKKDLASHPLLPNLESCGSPEDVLTVLREKIPAFSESQNGDDGLTKWVTPTVNVLCAFSDTLGQGAGLAFPAANVIFAGIGVLLSAVKDADTSLDKLIEVFNRIEYFFHRLEIYTGIVPTMAMRDIIIEIMVEVLTILAFATKEVKRGRLKKYLKKLIGNTEIEDSLDRLDKLTQEEARMASAEQLKMAHRIDVKVTGVDDRVKSVEGKVQDVRSDMHDVRGDMQDVRGDMHNVRSDVHGVRSDVHDVDRRVQGIGADISSGFEGVDHRLDQANRNHLRDSLSRWLSPPDPSTNHNIACKAHHDGTAQWFFRGSTFDEWKSTGSFLWIHGKPGSGKSILCSSIIQDIMALRDARRASMAYFYFDFRDVHKQKLRNLLPSLLMQLSARSDPCCDILSRLYSLHDRGLRKPSDRAMVECLKEMLTLEAQGPTYVIMDALDECPTTSTIPSPREEVLEFVEELVDLRLPNVHICVTSRPERDIRAFLERLVPRAVSLHDESGQQEDIAHYVASFIRSDRCVQRWREEDKDLVVKTLSERADGMFRWVFCQLEVMRQCIPPSVRLILKELPESLDETYERILKEIRKPNQRHAHRLLQCLVAAVRPLRVKELAEVLAVDFDPEGIPKLNEDWRWEDKEEAVMSACSSLVTIVNDGDSRVVQFSHFSVKEYLTANRLAESIGDISHFHIRLEAAHTILAQACLGVLLRLHDRVDRDSIENFPLALYAAQYWAIHARFDNASPQIKDGMESLFDANKPHFAAWVWIYDEDQYGLSMSTMCPKKTEAVPLYYVARLGFRDLAERLIAKHPEQVDAKGGRDLTPMHVAARAGHANILSLLIEHGADADTRDELGQTPLDRASRLGKLEAGQCLLDHGADINARNTVGWTPLVCAVIYGHVEFARMLLERRASINSHDNSYGRTPLHWAVERRNTQAVRLLLEHGADVNACDKLGRTPSQLARQKEIVELLSWYGAKSLE